ncbi:MAG: hypothetical protein AAGA54_17345 [Myxococcota bacterium]
MTGGVAAGAMGLTWLRVPPALGPSVWGANVAIITAYALLAALLAACLGGFLVLQGRTRIAAVVLCAAGIVPGLVEPRAFVATFLLVFAGLLAPAPRWRHPGSRVADVNRDGAGRIS